MKILKIIEIVILSLALYFLYKWGIIDSASVILSIKPLHLVLALVLLYIILPFIISYIKIMKEKITTPKWEHYYNKMTKFCDLAKPNDAVQNGELALKELMNCKKKSEIDLSMVKNTLGFSYSLRGDYKRAIEYLEESELICEESIKNSINHAYVLHHLGTCYSNCFNYEKAEKYFIAELSILEQYSDIDPLVLARCYNELSVIYRDTFNIELSLDYSEKALNIINTFIGKESREYFLVQYDIAMTNKLIGEVNKSEKILSECLPIAKRTLGEEHPDYATLLHLSAGIDMELGNFESSIEKYILVAENYKNISNPFNPNLAVVYCNLGMINSGMANYEKANNYFKESIRIIEKNKEWGNVYDFLPYIQYAYFHYSRKEFKKSRSLL